MFVEINGKKIEIAAVAAAPTAFDFRKNDKDGIVILNGYQIDSDRALSDGDTLCVIPKGVMPARGELETMLAARHSPGVHSRMKAGRIAVAGLGGVGSHAAVSLARMGVGKLLLVDFDIVEPSNLNRQHYSISHLGMYKTRALKNQITGINPYINTQICDIKIGADNAAEVFSGWPIVIEAFDNPVCKAALIEALLAAGDTKIISASGLAGLGPSNDIRTTRRLENLYLCGDQESEASEGAGLMAPRVAICAGHQANLAVRLLMEYDETRT